MQSLVRFLFIQFQRKLEILLKFKIALSIWVFNEFICILEFWYRLLPQLTYFMAKFLFQIIEMISHLQPFLFNSFVWFVSMWLIVACTLFQTLSNSFLLASFWHGLELPYSNLFFHIFCWRLIVYSSIYCIVNVGCSNSLPEK